MARNATKILVQPGELIWGASDLSTASPHGGTSLGYTADGIRLNHNMAVREILTEETGEAPQEVIYLGGRVTLEATFLQWDDTVIQRLFPNTSSGSSNEVAEFPGGTAYPGYKLSNTAGVLVFSPTDLTNNKVVLARNAVPIGSPREIVFRTAEPTQLSVLFICLPDTGIASGNARYDSRTVAIGDRGDLSIS